mgnify:CR=1 FL=1
MFQLFQRGRAMRHDNSGTVSIEMALVTIIVTGLLFGVVEIARYGQLRYHLELSTYHAARFLALNPADVDAAGDMIRAELERNAGSSVGDVQLHIKSTRRDGRCLFVVETRAQFKSEVLGWLFTDPSAESAQAWPQAEGCGETAIRPPSTAPTPTPVPTPTRTLVPPLKLDQVEGVAKVNANIRLGPGFEYAIVGRLNENEAVQVRGRDTTATWLQVVPERIGWVYAPLIQLDAPVSSLKTVDIPPIPLRTPVAPPYLRFEAVPKALKVGECAMLIWDAPDANFVTLNEANVAVRGEQQVCPAVDTTYVLSAGYERDRFYDREVKILIYPASDP